MGVLTRFAVGRRGGTTRPRTSRATRGPSASRRSTLGRGVCRPPTRPTKNPPGLRCRRRAVSWAARITATFAAISQPIVYYPSLDHLLPKRAASRPSRGCGTDGPCPVRRPSPTNTPSEIRSRPDCRVARGPSRPCLRGAARHRRQSFQLFAVPRRRQGPFAGPRSPLAGRRRIEVGPARDFVQRLAGGDGERTGQPRRRGQQQPAH